MFVYIQFFVYSVIPNKCAPIVTDILQKYFGHKYDNMGEFLNQTTAIIGVIPAAIFDLIQYFLPRDSGQQGE